jgi:hypothetical protein
VGASGASSMVVVGTSSSAGSVLLEPTPSTLVVIV